MVDRTELMVGEAAREKLYDAATKGDTATFEQVLQEDPYLLDRVSFGCSNRTPLHIATMQGNGDIVEKVMMRNPQLAQELDCQKSSPLHIAASKGYIGITSRLLLGAPDMCWSRDCQGMNPVHIAAVNGHVEILEELVELDPFPAMEKVERGQTVLHLCVKHRQLKALQVLVEKLGCEFVGAKDDDGETVMDLAVRYKQDEMIQYLEDIIKIERQAKLQILEGSPPPNNSRMTSLVKFLSKKSEVIMVVVILIATMAFQAVVSPPGGVWQDNSLSHKAGEAVMESSRPKIYKNFVLANTVAFVSSLITIFLLTTGLPATNFLFSLAVTYTTWMSLASIGVSYGASIMVITSNMETQSLARVNNIVVAVCFTLLGLYMAEFLLMPIFWRWMNKKSLSPNSLSNACERS